MIRSELQDLSRAQNNKKSKSVFGSVTYSPSDWKNKVRKIETKYAEVFYEGSFKFYNKLLNLNRFREPIHCIRI